MRTFAFLVFALPLALGAGGCSGSSGGSVSASQASSDLGTAICTKIDSCAPFYVDLTWPDVTTCASRTGIGVASTLAESSSGWTPSAIESCSKAIASASCSDVLDNNLPSVCNSPAGKLAVGMPCGDSSQCQSTYCNTGPMGICGTCAAARGAAGAPCYGNDDCAYGSVCVGADSSTPTPGACAQPAATGADCDTTAHPCEGTLVCKGTRCAAPDEAGASCSQGTCDSVAGLECQIATGQTTGTCAKVSLATAGSPCGLINGAITACSGGGTCVLSTNTTGTCKAAIADGMPCNASTPPGCLDPAVCTGGQCTVPDPSSCH